MEIGNKKIQDNLMSFEFPILCQIAEMADVLLQSVFIVWSTFLISPYFSQDF